MKSNSLTAEKRFLSLKPSLPGNDVDRVQLSDLTKKSWVVTPKLRLGLHNPIFLLTTAPNW